MPKSKESRRPSARAARKGGVQESVQPRGGTRRDPRVDSDAPPPPRATTPPKLSDRPRETDPPRNNSSRTNPPRSNSPRTHPPRTRTNPPRTKPPRETAPPVSSE